MTSWPPPPAKTHSSTAVHCWKNPRAPKECLNWLPKRLAGGRELPAGQGRGLSVQHVFGTYLSEVAEVEVAKDGPVRVKRVVCAVDCGQVVNPDTVRAQLESGVIFGITAALYGAITLKDGRVEQSNFDNYRMLRIGEAPKIEVYIVESTEAPGGMGEPGTSALAPAVANAIFAATANGCASCRWMPAPCSSGRERREKSERGRRC